jgi:hypothetical protein
MENKILVTTAMLDDAAAMEKFLSSIPNGQTLAKVLELGKPVSTRAYEDEAWTARFVESDGRIAACFTVTDVTIDQAEMIAGEMVAAELLASDRAQVHAWGAESFAAAVQLALGADFLRVE